MISIMSEGKIPDTYVEIMSLPNNSAALAVCVSADGSRLFSGGPNKTIKVWDMTGACLYTLEGHTSMVVTLCVSPDGSRLFSGSYDNTIKVWDVATGACLQRLQGHTDSVFSVCVSGSRLFSGSRDNTIKVWDLATGACLQTLVGHAHWVFSVRVSGSRLFSGSADKTIKVWDVATGTRLQTLEGHKDEVLSVCVFGDRLFSGSADKTIKVWDVAGACLQTLEGHTSWVWSVCVSGSRLFSGSMDETIKVWDVATGACLQTLHGHALSVVRVCVSGSRLFSGSFDKTIKVWELGDGVEFTGSVSIQDGIDQVFADADIVDVDALDLPDPGHSGRESKTSDYITMGYVSPYKKELNIELPDFSGFKCYHKRLDPRLQCQIAKEVQKCREDVQKVERLRWSQRNMSPVTFRSHETLGRPAKQSVYLFLCVKNTDDTLQPDLNVYVYCAFALQSLGWKHRMVIYDERVTHDSLLATAAELKYPLSAAFLKQNVTCMPYVNSYDKLQTAVKDIEDDEEIALVYLSAHGDVHGILYGPWDKGRDIELSPERLVSFCRELNTNASEDCQVFLNSCYAGKSTAIVLSHYLRGRIILAASESIPSGEVYHRFQIDAGNNRLYFSAQCPPSEIKAYSAHFVDAASVQPQRRLERQSSGNPRPNQRRRREYEESLAMTFGPDPSKWGSETESEDEPSPYIPTSPDYSPTSPSPYIPTSPDYSPTSPSPSDGEDEPSPYIPRSPDYSPTSPSPSDGEETASEWGVRYGYPESQRSPPPSPRGYTNVSFRF